MSTVKIGAEQRRLEDNRADSQPWRKWGPYFSERQWGTVREDYSSGGNTWEYLSHEYARSRAYRWGEDGLTGMCDEKARLCLVLALWNGRDPILKKRLFGLSNGEGNHGEVVKELYYYLDAIPTHSCLRMLYKYPKGELPYPLFYEYFHGDTGRGVGALRQTGWTGLFATLIQQQKVNQ